MPPRTAALLLLIFTTLLAGCAGSLVRQRLLIHTRTEGHKASN